MYYMHEIWAQMVEVLVCASTVNGARMVLDGARKDGRLNLVNCACQAIVYLY